MIVYRIMALNWKKMTRPIIALSPMADMTDSAFCRLVRLIDVGGSCHGVCTPSVVSSPAPLDKGAGCGPPTGDPTPCHPPTSMNQSPILFREMVSAEAVVRGNQKTLVMTEIHEDERPIVQQIFGSDPDVMAEAARKIEEEHHPDGIDINMGCPVYKIVHNFNGAALMNEPERAAEIVKKIKSAVSVPVSIKIRTGWSDQNQCLEFARVLEQAGADLITVHGRTKTQGYSGKSDWDKIREVKERVSIPVLANGDIFSAELAMQALEQTKCDGISIARGALGNPWIFRQINELLAENSPSVISWQERIETIKKHFELHIEQYGERGVVTFRKHISWYLKGIAGSKQLKEKLYSKKTIDKVNETLDEILLTHSI